MSSYRCLVLIFSAALLLTFQPRLSQAEFRTWTASTGGFTTEAEFVELRAGNMVHLRLRGGAEKDVPLDRLSAADQEFVRSHTSQRQAGKGDRVAKLEREADRAPTAEEALRLYRVFRDDPATTEAEKQAITPRMEELGKLAEKKMVRIGNRWATTEEFRERRNKANALMKAGLEMLRLKQEDAFRSKFAEAAKVEPETIRADFLMGILYSMLTSNYTKSKQYFDLCAKREPDNVAVLNNQALAALRRGDMTIALASWRKAVKLQPNQFIVQNLGRLLDQASKKKLNVPKGMLDNAVDMYTTLLATEKFQRADLKRGFMWMFIDEESMSLAKQGDAKKMVESPAPKPSEDGSAVIGGGTGFVVFPHYVLTNNHVIAGGTSFDLQTSDGSKDHLLRATLVARSEKPDLALLKCDDLPAAPVPIDPAPLGRGTDIMTLGYPEMFALGASLKATRGVISAVPSSAVDDMYLYDAVINHGNSGGPVCDSRGNVVAVTTVMTTTEGKFGGGIPSAAALAFVQQHVPGFQQLEISQQPLDWPGVDQKVSPATVLVWTRSKTPGSGATVDRSGFYEDRDCLVCNALGVVKCNAQGCNGGVVLVRKGSTTTTERCPVCGGKSIMKCPICTGTGVDPELQQPAQSPVPTSPPPGAPGGPLVGPPPDAAPPNGIANNGNGGMNVPGAPPAQPGAPTNPRYRTRPPGVPGMSPPPQVTREKPPAPPADLSQQLDHGEFAALSGQKLDESLAESIRIAIKAVQTVDTEELGHGDIHYRDVDKGGGLLIGLFFAYGKFFDKPTVGARRPIFLNRRGKENGEWHGGRMIEGRHVVAKPGYAVGAVRIRAGIGIDSFQLVFMRISGDRLDPNDAYESPWYGGQGGSHPVTLGGDGALVVGIVGQVPKDPKGTANSLGLVTFPVKQ